MTPEDPQSSAQKGPQQNDFLQKIAAFLVDSVWQLVCIGGALLVFYEDRVLCLLGIAGFVGLICSVLCLEVIGYVPTRGDRLWGVVIPGCSTLAVVISVTCRLRGHMVAPWAACFVCLALAAGLSTVAIRGDKDARMPSHL